MVKLNQINEENHISQENTIIRQAQVKNIYGGSNAAAHSGLMKGGVKPNGSASASSLEQLYNEMGGQKKHSKLGGSKKVNPQLGSLSPSRQAGSRNLVNSSVDSSNSENRQVNLPQISNNSPMRGSPTISVGSNPYNIKRQNVNNLG